MNDREGDSMTNKGEGVINLECDNGGRGRKYDSCLLYTSPSPRDISGSRMPSSA